MLTTNKGQFRSILIEYVELSINVILHLQQSFLRHFFTVAVDQLDVIIIVRIVVGGNHDTTVEVIHTGDVSYRRSDSNMIQVSICTGSNQASDQDVLKHTEAAIGILANDDTSRIDVTIALT